MAQKTAVEWLNEMLRDNHKKVFDGNIWEQAKAMEKEIIIEAYKADCDTLGHTNQFNVAAEQYYNENFKSNQNETETN